MGNQAYKTKQRSELIGYMETIPGVHFTVADVCAYFRSKGKQIGTTTVYRQIERMVDEGLVGKYIIDAGAPACFAYMPKETHQDDTVCFHCKCEKCGRLIHLHCDELKGIGTHLKERHGFSLNPMRTVFYGVCDSCGEKA